MSHVPYLLDDDTLIENLELPSDVEPIKPITRERETARGRFLYWQSIKLLNIQNEANENELREWSFKSAGRERQFEWLYIYLSTLTRQRCIAVLFVKRRIRS